MFPLLNFTLILAADDERREIAAEDLETDPVLLDSSPPPQPPAEPLNVAQTSGSEQPLNQFLSGGANGAVLRLNGPSVASSSGVQRRPYPYAGPETKYAFRGVDFGCKLCARLLHDPTVLVCGHSKGSVSQRQDSGPTETFGPCESTL